MIITYSIIIYYYRIKFIINVNRQEIAEYVKKVLILECPLTLDGKIIKDVIGYETVDCLTILISGKSFDKLFAISKLISGIGP